MYEGVLLLLAALCLIACSESDDVDSGAGGGDVLQIGAYAQSLTDGQQAGTRAVTPDNYEAYSDNVSIGIFMTYQKETGGGWTVDPVSTVTYETGDDAGTPGKWNSLVNVKTYLYYIYGFMPGSVSENVTISPYSDSYTNGAVFTMRHLSSVMSEDVCLLTGVQDIAVDAPDLDLRRGVFAYQGKEKGKNFSNLMLDHLYACVRFRMKVDADYAKLRDIHLKTLRLICAGSGSVELSATVSANSTGDDPVSAISMNHVSGGSSSATLYDHADGQPLGITDATAIEVNGYMAPITDVGRNLSIACTYDVLDKSGKLVRQDCTATNSLSSENLNLKRGQRVTFNLTVNPTYLYVLSEPDLDNPSVTIN